MSVWGSGGRIELTAARFMAIQAAIQPDCYQSMADGETWQASTSRKRVRKAVDRSLAHLDECLVLHQKTQVSAQKHRLSSEYLSVTAGYIFSKAGKCHTCHIVNYSWLNFSVSERTTE